MKAQTFKASIRFSRSALNRAVITASFLVLSSCADEPTLPEAVLSGSRLTAAEIAAVQDVPAVTRMLPPTPRPWDTDDAALIAVLTEQDGHAIIAFKPPSRLRASDAAGYRAALPAATFLQGLRHLEREGVDILEVLGPSGAALVRLNPELGPELRRHPLVDFLEPRQWGTVAGAPATIGVVPAIKGNVFFGQVTPWGVSMVRAPAAWTVNSGSGVKVMIIDTGVNPHEDLPDITHCGGLGQYDGVCRDANYFHGTHVAGTLLARSNGIGVVGAAPGVEDSLVYSRGACDSNSSIITCTNTSLAAGINNAISNGVKVINMSLQMPYDAGVAQAVADAWATGSIVLVAAAGNNAGATVVYPAGYPHVVGVSGVSSDSSFPSGSNYGPHVDLAAPFCALSTVGTNGYEGEADAWCGTSMATPHVSGAAAIVWGRNPTWTSQQVLDRLYATAEDLGVIGRDDHFGYGLVDAASAVGPVVFISGPTRITEPGSYLFEANASSGDGSYTYQWHIRYPEISPTWGGWGTSQAQYLNVEASDGDIELRVTVTSAGASWMDASHYVTNAGGCEPGVFCTP